MGEPFTLLHNCQPPRTRTSKIHQKNDFFFFSDLDPVPDPALTNLGLRPDLRVRPKSRPEPEAARARVQDSFRRRLRRTTRPRNPRPRRQPRPRRERRN